MELSVYRASAGSGKTFTLAVEYIKLLIINPLSYKNILAVTFTNKATAEMKERILQQLWGIWKNDKDSEAYFKVICDYLSKSGYGDIDEETVRRRAGEALCNIMHDYGRFTVCTIDSFFQSVTRSISRELGIGSNMDIELEDSRVVDEAVDNMIAKLDSKSETLSWILDFIGSKVDDGKQWHIDKDLKEFGRNNFNEYYMEMGNKLRSQLEDRKCVKDYIRTLILTRENAIAGLKHFESDMIAMFDNEGIEPSELSYSKDIINYFKKLGSGNVSAIEKGSKRVENMIADPGYVVSRASKKYDFLMSFVENCFAPLVEKAEKARNVALRTIWGCNMAKRYIYQLQLLNEIGREATQENKEKNRLLLAETNKMLSELIGGDDSSFIFEKMGANIRNIMIDEFQDTSRMQWHNFNPLLKEGLSQGADSLIVGDVKQSIYRWRNGDWNILNDLREQDSPYKIRIKTLDINRRSETNIISFNNKVFKLAVDYINNVCMSETGEDCRRLISAYSDVEQKTSKKDKRGYVKVVVMNDEGDNSDFTEDNLEALGEEVKKQLEAGVPMRDIAILVRFKKHIEPIALYFDQNFHLSIVSDEAFRLDSSPSVNMLVNAVKWLADPTDKIASAVLAMDYQTLVMKNKNQNDELDINAILVSDLTDVLPNSLLERKDELCQMPLYELMEELYAILGLSVIERQDSYIFKFLDEITNYLSDNSSELNAFLDYWEETMCRKTIPGEGVEGIRVLTIHSSKGLEYGTVIIPFCDWSMTTWRIDHLVWCKPKESPFDGIDLVPVTYSEKMGKTVFCKDFEEERLQLWVDNLNIMYVAFTRAVKNLVIITSNANKRKSKDGQSVYMMMRDILPKIAVETGGIWNEDKQTFELGEICLGGKRKKDTQNILSIVPSGTEIKMVSHSPEIEFRESNRSAEFIAGTSEDESEWHYMDRGRLMHAIFSAIKTVDDTDRAVENLVSEGVISSGEMAEEIKLKAKDALNMPQIREWFDGSWRLFNECEIVWLANGELKQKRPDRVMMKNGETVVVDYKFGNPKKKYNNQVKEYMSLLSSMGYTNISGYLWYVDNKKVEKV